MSDEVSKSRIDLLQLTVTVCKEIKCSDFEHDGHPFE